MIDNTYSRYTRMKNVLDKLRLQGIVVPPDIKLERYTTNQNDRLTGIAFNKLGSSQYFWIIAEINDIIEYDIIFGTIGENKILYIPAFEIVNRLQSQETK